MFPSGESARIFYFTLLSAFGRAANRARRPFWARWNAGRVYSMPGTIIMWAPPPPLSGGHVHAPQRGERNHTYGTAIWFTAPMEFRGARIFFVRSAFLPWETSHNLLLLICGFSNFSLPPLPRSLLLPLPRVSAESHSGAANRGLTVAS